MTHVEPQQGEPIVLIYDHECPMCKMYASMIKLQEGPGNFSLLSSHEDHETIRQIKNQGIDLNRGMVLMIGPRYYHGAEALHMISLLTSRSDSFNRLSYWLFKSRWRSNLCYPVLRSIRSLLLFILRKPKIQ